MKFSQEADDPRRRILIQALALGFFSGTAAGSAGAAEVFGSSPSKLPEGQSIYKLSGSASVNGKSASLATPIGPGDVVETGKDGELIFAVGGHSMILRKDSKITVEGKRENKSSILITGLRIFTGAILSVSRNTGWSIRSPTATIGIRGTGVYIEADPEQTYFCTCYGLADIAATSDPESKETVAATHHDRPLYIVADAKAGANIRRAPFVNHTDQELALIETLVGRTPPWVFPGTEYTAPRRDY